MLAAMEPTAHSAEARQPPPSLETVAAAFPQLEILELIGQGGMGSVFKARQPKLNRLVALQLLPGFARGTDAAVRQRGPTKCARSSQRSPHRFHQSSLRGRPM
jgi:hypothetical protein